MCECVSVCVRVCVCACVHVFSHTNTHMCVYVCVCVCVRAHTMYTHTNITGQYAEDHSIMHSGDDS